MHIDIVFLNVHTNLRKCMAGDRMITEKIQPVGVMSVDSRYSLYMACQ